MALLDLGATPVVLKAILARRGLCRPHVTHPLSALDARQRHILQRRLTELEGPSEIS